MPFIRHNGRHILFIHIPKTGGTTVEDWMSDIAPLRLRTVGMPQALKYTPQHFSFTDVRNLFGENFFDYAFAIVRNPYDRLASEYRMQYSISRRGMWAGFQSFSMWVENVALQARQTPWVLDNHIRPQWEFLAEEVKVFRFEDGLDNIVAKTAAEAGLPHSGAPLPRLIHTDDFDGEIKWDIREIETVRQLYQQDFELFGYDIDTVPGK